MGEAVGRSVADEGGKDLGDMEAAPLVAQLRSVGPPPRARMGAFNSNFSSSLPWDARAKILSAATDGLFLSSVAVSADTLCGGSHARQ